MSEQVEIKLPEGQQEGTISNVGRWLKAIGEKVALDEPILELETDKVNTEVASPSAGILSAILKQEGDEVKPGEVLGLLDTTENKAMPAQPVPSSPSIPASPLPPQVEPGGNDCSKLLSPSVRRLFSSHGLDSSMITGTGRGGRITLGDVKNYLTNAESTSVPANKSTSSSPSIPQHRGNSRMIPHDKMRLRIADHMVDSLLRVAPHVTSIFEMDLSAIILHRETNKAYFGSKNVKLTYTAYFVAAVVEAMKVAPEVNSRFHAQALEIFDDVNIGVGTALGNKGLIVPVIHQAQNQSLLGIAARLQDLTDRARAGKLQASEVQNGTFTISNHGVSGSLIATPVVINQPQSAILGIGKMQKRMMVVQVGGQDAAVIKPMCYVTLSIDHRALDAYQANGFLSRFVEVIENWK